MCTMSSSACLFFSSGILKGGQSSLTESSADNNEESSRDKGCLTANTIADEAHKDLTDDSACGQ
jgi:hypothetical protein